ncbi:MAG: hypothetical protein NC347_05600 [Clostridium sp.]|nr:hypothetical protein [Clostridium sp.]
MTDNELLLAISDILDNKLRSNLAPVENRLTNIELTLENNILPRLQNIESCYTSTYERYKNYAEKIESAFADIEIMKKVIAEHSEKLQKIS